MTQAAISDTLAQELYEFLRWFGRLRWLAAGALATASMAGPQFGVSQIWPNLLFVALVVAAYNVYFQWALRRPRGENRSLEYRQVQAVFEILLDLSALLVAVHFTGGLRSPMLPFFVFHMAIGTMMLSARTMYTIAAVTCLGVFVFYVAEFSSLLSYHPIDPGIADHGRASDLSMLTFIVMVFATVYLTGRVARQSKQRNIQLLEATMQLRNKTTELEGALNEIQELEHRKSHYMRISAHQLRSPLATVKTSLQVATKGYVDPASERGQEILQGSVERIDGLLAIVNDLLELAKIREGQRNAPWTRNVDVRRILLEIVEAVTPTAKKRGIRLLPNLKNTALLSWGVPPDLRFALENLVHNAIRYSRSHGEVRVCLEVSSDEATISVVDHGIGIPRDLQRDVFLEFVRAPNAKHHAPQGTGLGLTIVKEAVEMHGGSVSLQSNKGMGTSFTVKLPLMNTLPPGARVMDAAIEAEEGIVA